ncbi:hypothetical protein IB238_05510 [Rhizobium sp. ARZ01]|uniref:hypothetical protein n=1 Tax=Rhizobium sp. ARZ01 TaxID=2769313 RepID=UPI00177B62A7|nr:hypothetical protein [Rhizobium sp. ARZ01]MBD9372086.1 hypothetical protein [Rhizobium sp. ARZ01]
MHQAPRDFAECPRSIARDLARLRADRRRQLIIGLLGGAGCAFITATLLFSFFW